MVAAVAMVVAALVFRASRDNDSSSDGSGALRIVCAAELGSACGQFATEPAATTAARLSTSARADLDGWLVPAPWPELVDQARARQQLDPLFLPAGSPVATSRLVLAIQRDPAQALPACASAPTWRCIGDAAGSHALKLGHASPDTDPVGLLFLGQAVTGYFGRTDVSTVDLEADDTFQGWFTALERSVPSFDDDAMNTMLINPAMFHAVATIAADAQLELRRAAPEIRDRVRLLYPAPMATADVVLAPVGGDRAPRVRQLAASATTLAPFKTAGWDVPGKPAGTTPSAGLLEALRQRWREVRR